MGADPGVLLVAARCNSSSHWLSMSSPRHKHSWLAKGAESAKEDASYRPEIICSWPLVPDLGQQMGFQSVGLGSMDRRLMVCCLVHLVADRPRAI